MATRRKVTPEELRAALARQPLVGHNRAAEILGIKPPNMAKLRDSGQLPEPVPVEGSAAVFVRSEIEELARARKRGKAAQGG